MAVTVAVAVAVAAVTAVDEDEVVLEWRVARSVLLTAAEGSAEDAAAVLDAEPDAADGCRSESAVAVAIAVARLVADAAELELSVRLWRDARLLESRGECRRPIAPSASPASGANFSGVTGASNIGLGLGLGDGRAITSSP